MDYFWLPTLTQPQSVLFIGPIKRQTANFFTLPADSRVIKKTRLFEEIVKKSFLQLLAEIFYDHSCYQASQFHKGVHVNAKRK